MAKRAFDFQSYTPTVNGAGTTATSSTYQAMTGGAATQQILVYEIYIGGQASASAINGMCFTRNATVATTPTALTTTTNSDGYMPSNASALAASALVWVAASTGGIRSTATGQSRLNLSLNAFGGIVRWVAAPGEEWGIMGTGANVESTLIAQTGSPGLQGSHIVYETFISDEGVF